MLHSVAVAEAVECYICSWNPSDYKNDNNNHDYNDVCSAGHFDPERVRTHDCSRGCEIVSMKDANGKSHAVRQVAQNCNPSHCSESMKSL
jgi:hypothetical protein